MLNFGNKEFRNLQEQVLKNAQDIEVLKGREDLQIVIVNELPEVGNPNYIYLVAKDDGEAPDVYDEYIWLEDEERYEKIGGVTIDLTNYVTLDSEQTISGEKNIKGTLNFVDATETSSVVNSIKTDQYGGMNFSRSGITAFAVGGADVRFNSRHLLPNANNTTYNLGASNSQWKDLYLGGNANFGANGVGIKYDAANYRLIIKTNGGYEKYIFGDTFYAQTSMLPIGTNTYNLGSSSNSWKDLYLTGNISDGANTVSVANIASKATSTFISGTFDSNGESTIDTEQAGTPEGLFIFTYGNCQCFLRLTATMVQNADTTPIRVACPMIYNSDTVNGWLNITKSGYILILKITDGTNHVDSGYSWTLTKTNLI